MSPIINISELLKIYQNENVVLIDASNTKDSKLNYDAKHLKGALFVDMNLQLADLQEDPSNGGRHPLPSIENFSETITELGISKNSHVIIHDNANGTNAAARFWWMLQSVGHEKVQVLNGGFKEAEKNGFPISNEIEVAKKVEAYHIEKWNLPLSDINEVEKVSKSNDYVVIDVRHPERFAGTFEPIDINSGHIPGAVNEFYLNNLDENGLLLPQGEIKKKYQKIFDYKKPENIIIHCGSGVTACHTILSVAYAGLEIPKLYVGSWSEWSNSDKEIVVEN